jgi:hypothetical protein
MYDAQGNNACAKGINVDAVPGASFAGCLMEETPLGPLGGADTMVSIYDGEGNLMSIAANQVNVVNVFDAREFIGAGIQGGLVAWAGAGFDGKHFEQFVGGALTGMSGSDSSNHWFAEGNEVLKGATRGALSGSISGVMTGKIDWRQIGTGAAMGAFYTKSVARLIPFTGGRLDPRSSASFGAVNAVAGAVLRDGSKVNARDIAMAAAGGIYSSGQIQRAIAGTGGRVSTTARTTVASGAYAAANAGAGGGDAEAVSMAVYGSVIPSVLGATVLPAIGAVEDATLGRVESAVQGTAQDIYQGVTGQDGAKKKTKDKATQEQFVTAVEEDFNALAAELEGNRG